LTSLEDFLESARRSETSSESSTEYCGGGILRAGYVSEKERRWMSERQVILMFGENICMMAGDSYENDSHRWSV
jgi:hypothetical protein